VTAMRPTFFSSSAELRAWFEEHHDRETELWVGYYKQGSGKPSITHREALDLALCFGWIDGIRQGIDAVSYTNRFTPRKPRSNWSAVNIKRVGELTELGMMHPAGLAAFERRAGDASGYSYEQVREARLDPAYEGELKADPGAWTFFQAQAPWYRRTATYWVMSAKREETRRRRLATLIEDSRQGRRIAPLARPGRPES
jgi:uncharacterized protein YdeI (YjbR/CyaY-like superfamily)